MTLTVAIRPLLVRILQMITFTCMSTMRESIIRIVLTTADRDGSASTSFCRTVTVTEFAQTLDADGFHSIQNSVA